VVPPAAVANDAVDTPLVSAVQANDLPLIMRIWRDVPLYRYPLSLRFSPFQDDESNSITRASAVGVEQIIVPAIGSAVLCPRYQTCRDYPALYAALGLHPIIIEEHGELHERLEQLLATRPQKVVAIGGDWSGSLS
jgi:hypothetical protein